MHRGVVITTGIEKKKNELDTGMEEEEQKIVGLYFCLVQLVRHLVPSGCHS